MKQFLYRFEDGTELQIAGMTNALLNELRSRHGSLTFNGFTDQLTSLHLLRANSHSRGDGFKPGFHPGLGIEIRSNEQYQRILKEKGMVEVGKEQQRDQAAAKPDIAGTVIQEAISQGAQLSGQEIAKIKGEIA
jgi:hypothetical protein